MISLFYKCVINLLQNKSNYMILRHEVYNFGGNTCNDQSKRLAINRSYIAFLSIAKWELDSNLFKKITVLVTS